MFSSSSILFFLAAVGGRLNRTHAPFQDVLRPILHINMYIDDPSTEITPDQSSSSSSNSGGNHMDVDDSLDRQSNNNHTFLDFKILQKRQKHPPKG
jgi:hypothetical protein